MLEKVLPEITDSRLQLITKEKIGQLSGSNSNFNLIDVRTHEEYSIYNLTGFISIPLENFDRGLHELLDITHPAIIACEDGIRSKKAAEILLQLGLPGVYILEGGLKAAENLTDYGANSSISIYSRSSSGL